MEKPVWERASFFKVMFGNFQTSLRIPPSFVKHLPGECVKFILRCRGGRQWPVKIERVGKGLFFGEGWECFVSDLSITMGEFLLFAYDGNLGFEVKIYGITGCEKEDTTHFVKMEEGICTEEQVVETRIIRSSKHWRKVVNGRVILEGSKVFNNERALESARSFKSSHPFFIATYRNSRQEYMTIPMSIKRECKLGEMETIILQDPKGRPWPARIAHWKGRVALAGGWTKFRDGNYLSEGDVCVFEFLAEDNSMHVHIFRVDGNPESEIRKTVTNMKWNVEAPGRFKAFARFASVCKISRKYNMNIPAYVMKGYDAMHITKTNLCDPSGRSWSVQVRQRLDGRMVLGRGWSEFWKANHIKEGDVCVFDLAKGIEAMSVQIRRVGQQAISAV
ncbi:hypothetical protein HPP92_014045 [Vanilla planifolia]|uniref:TF-B3 domain-containing protein n=1 Tax=Vanilla planifolia TaxID=51239 RepID=A0A835UVC0_VANPL|nr:hypothetical protein HPP92_014045 [Vanilla planifolia]